MWIGAGAGSLQARESPSQLRAARRGDRSNSATSSDHGSTHSLNLGDPYVSQAGRAARLRTLKYCEYWSGNFSVAPGNIHRFVGLLTQGPARNPNSHRNCGDPVAWRFSLPLRAFANDRRRLFPFYELAFIPRGVLIEQKAYDGPHSRTRECAPAITQ